MGYHKQCKYCEDEIYLDNQEDGEWHAYDDEYCESLHSCRREGEREFEIECKWCGEDIVLKQLSSGKWTPLEPDGLRHSCTEREKEEDEEDEEEGDDGL